MEENSQSTSRHLKHPVPFHLESLDHQIRTFPFTTLTGDHFLQPPFSQTLPSTIISSESDLKNLVDLAEHIVTHFAYFDRLPRIKDRKNCKSIFPKLVKVDFSKHLSLLNDKLGYNVEEKYLKVPFLVDIIRRQEILNDVWMEWWDNFFRPLNFWQRRRWIHWYGSSDDEEEEYNEYNNGNGRRGNNNMFSFEKQVARKNKSLWRLIQRRDGFRCRLSGFVSNIETNADRKIEKEVREDQKWVDDIGSMNTRVMYLLPLGSKLFWTYFCALIGINKSLGPETFECPENALFLADQLYFLVGLFQLTFQKKPGGGDEYEASFQDPTQERFYSRWPLQRDPSKSWTEQGKVQLPPTLLPRWKKDIPDVSAEFINLHKILSEVIISVGATDGNVFDQYEYEDDASDEEEEEEEV